MKTAASYKAGSDAEIKTAVSSETNQEGRCDTKAVATNSWSQIYKAVSFNTFTNDILLILQWI